jgi:hypothetical protein
MFFYATLYYQKYIFNPILVLGRQILEGGTCFLRERFFIEYTPYVFFGPTRPTVLHFDIKC